MAAQACFPQSSWLNWFVWCRRQTFPHFRIFSLTLKKASEYNEKSKEKSLILHEFTEMSGSSY
jgi:hypothetical protein